MRALALCRQVGETLQLFPVLGGLCVFYMERAELQTADELAQQLLRLAQRVHDPLLLLWVYSALGSVSFFRGECAPARHFLE
jgi:hypothetical protein